MPSDASPERWLAEARAAQADYDAENPNDSAAGEEPEGPPLSSSPGFWAAMLIMVGHGAVVRYGGVDLFADRYGASSVKILGGELFRTVTALMLHADVVHLAGNMAGCALFFPAVCGLWGFGGGAMAILCGGVLGNWINALVHRRSHLSIGASTAVFAAVGILIGDQALKRVGSDGSWERAWLPVGAGICLLGFLSAGENTDILAHLFGFLVGCALGAARRFLRVKPSGDAVQYLLLLICFGIIAGGWLRLY